MAKGWHQRSGHITMDKIKEDVKRKRNSPRTGRRAGKYSGYRLVVRGKLRKASVYQQHSGDPSGASPGWDPVGTLRISVRERGSSHSSTLPGCGKGKREERGSYGQPARLRFLETHWNK